MALWKHRYICEKGVNSKKLQESFNNYGWESFEFKILEVIEDIKILKQQEEYWTRYYDTQNTGYNQNIADKKSEEVKKIISEKTKEAMKKVDRNKLASRKGISPTNKGTKLSEEERKIISILTKEAMKKVDKSVYNSWRNKGGDLPS